MDAQILREKLMKLEKQVQELQQQVSSLVTGLVVTSVAKHLVLGSRDPEIAFHCATVWLFGHYTVDRRSM